MRCKEAWQMLADVMGLKTIKASSSEVKEMEALGLIARTGGQDASTIDPEFDSMRARIRDIAKQKDDLGTMARNIGSSAGAVPPRRLYKENARYRQVVDSLEALEKEERALRTRFVNAAQKVTEKVSFSTINGVPYIITYKGRDLLSTMNQRIDRIGGMDLKAFLSEISLATGYFDGRSEKAQRILKVLSPKFPKKDEIHLRLVAVGLSGHPGNVDDAIGLFETAYREISSEVFSMDSSAMILAEIIALASRSPTDLRRRLNEALELIKVPWQGSFVSEDQVRATAIIMASGGQYRDKVERTRRISGLHCPYSLSAAAVIACSDDEDAVTRFASILPEISLDHTDTLGDPMAAALLASSSIAPATVLWRYWRAWNILQRFNGGSMKVPAAMVSILPYDVDEAMDNARLASASIIKYQLSLGGAENLSLGIKLLVHSSAMATVEGGPGAVGGAPVPAGGSGVPPVLAMTGVTVAAALIIGAGLLAFHEFSLHRLAVHDYTFHPVHTHFVYG
jgi:hypothetical protein